MRRKPIKVPPDDVRLKDAAVVEGETYRTGRIVAGPDQYGTFTVEVGAKGAKSVIFITKSHFVRWGGGR